MTLRSDFGGLKGSIWLRSSPPSVDSVVSELLVEEICLKKSHSKKEILSALNPSMFVAASKPPSNNQRTYTTVAFDECNFYKQKGHQSSVSQIDILELVIATILSLGA